MRNSLFALIAVLSSTTACSYVTQEQGQKMMDDIAKLQRQSQDLDKQATDLQSATREAKAELKKLRGLVDEATKVVTRNSADLGLTVEKMQVDLATLTGRVDDLNNTVTSLQKSFQDYAAKSDTKLEQLTNNTQNAKNPPIPEKPDDIMAEADRRFKDKNYVDARRLWDAFLTRFPTDSRAPKAQFLMGESYMAENRWANAIASYTKVIDNFPKSEIVPDAMYRNGLAFYALKYCGDARIYFQELLRRYPKTEWKSDANEQLKKLAKDMKNKAVCSS